MTKVTIELPEGYEDVLSITAVGGVNMQNVSATVYVVDLRKGTRLSYDGEKWDQRKELSDKDAESI